MEVVYFSWKRLTFVFSFWLIREYQEINLAKHATAYLNGDMKSSF